MSGDGDKKKDPKHDGLGRRDFMKLGALGALSANLVGSSESVAAQPDVRKGEVVSGEIEIRLQINGRRERLRIEPRVTLLDALRDRLALTGTKKVCDRGACGACTVRLDGQAIYACGVLAVEAEGREIRTIESLELARKLHPLQEEFIERDTLQCGFCTPGLLMACEALVDAAPQATADQLRWELGGNLCRCGSYPGIPEAAAAASDRIRRPPANFNPYPPNRRGLRARGRRRV